VGRDVPRAGLGFVEFGRLSMVLGLAPTVLAVVLSVVFLGGLLKGVTGFGYALASTAILAGVVLEPAEAVVVMILPMLVANVVLLGELDRADIAPCVRRFWPFVAAAVVGTVAGMTLLQRLPTAPLALGLGLFTLAYVVLTQDVVRVPGKEWVAARCFQPGTAVKFGLGLAAGLVFGATNVAVQVVAYLDRLSLSRGLFVGVLSMVLVGISAVRIGVAWWLGLYGGADLPALSVLAVVPGLVGVGVGGRLRSRIPARVQTLGGLGLLALIGLQLAYNGLQGL
jgi:uncharacterized membrane protein YfcA